MGGIMGTMSKPVVVNAPPYTNHWLMTTINHCPKRQWPQSWFEGAVCFHLASGTPFPKSTRVVIFSRAAQTRPHRSSIRFPYLERRGARGEEEAQCQSHGCSCSVWVGWGGVAWRDFSANQSGSGPSPWPGRARYAGKGGGMMKARAHEGRSVESRSATSHPLPPGEPVTVRQDKRGQEIGSQRVWLALACAPKCRRGGVGPTSLPSRPAAAD